MKRFIAIALIAVMILAFGGCGKSEAVLNCEELISSIGEISIESEDLIIRAEEAVAVLAEDEVKRVSNYDELVDSRNTWETLKENQLKEQAASIDSAIASIGEVSISSESDILAARTAYDEADEKVKNYVEKYDALVAAENQFESFNLSITAGESFSTDELELTYYNTTYTDILFPSQGTISHSTMAGQMFYAIKMEATNLSNSPIDLAEYLILSLAINGPKRQDSSFILLETLDHTQFELNYSIIDVGETRTFYIYQFCESWAKTFDAKLLVNDNLIISFADVDSELTNTKETLSIGETKTYENYGEVTLLDVYTTHELHADNEGSFASYFEAADDCFLIVAKFRVKNLMSEGIYIKDLFDSEFCIGGYNYPAYNLLLDEAFSGGYRFEQAKDVEPLYEEITYLFAEIPSELENENGTLEITGFGHQFQIDYPVDR